MSENTTRAPQVGDLVEFTGTRHYTSASASRGTACRPGPARVTNVAANGKHPYHIIHTDGTSNVYGWVNASDVKVTEESAATPASPTGFTPRMSKPGKGNKYFIRQVSGGYNRAIKGSPTDPDCDVLHNCVGYAHGRFNEIVGKGNCDYLAPVNAENFIQYKNAGLQVSQTPQVGACMVWQKGATLSGSDGAGHVAIVERVISATEVVTSESGYGAKSAFWTQTRKKGNGNWGQGTGYKFLGFILNPAPCCQGSTPAPAPAPTPDPAPTPTPAVTKKTAKGVAHGLNRSLTGTYSVTAAEGLHIRDDARTTAASLVVIPKNTKVQNYGYYTMTGGVRWLYIQVQYNGVIYTGFSSSQYLKKL